MDLILLYGSLIYIRSWPVLPNIVLKQVGDLNALFFQCHGTALVKVAEILKLKK